MPERLDEILKTELMTPPDDFTARVMHRIAGMTSPAPAVRRNRVQDIVEWLALAGALLAGTSQLIAFLFSMWIVTSAA